MNAFFVYMRLHIVRDVITEVSIEHWTGNPGFLVISNEPSSSSRNAKTLPIRIGTIYDRY